MNLNVLERMVKESDLSLAGLRYLIGCRGECEWLDFKENLKLDNDKEASDFTKDILGMKNVGGGYIVVGVKDKTWMAVGLDAPAPYDTKLLRDKIRGCAGVDLDVDTVSHQLPIIGADRWFTIIHVRSSKKRKKRRIPTLAGKDFCPTQSFGLRRGEIYARKGDSTVKIQSERELEELLDILESNSDQDALQSEGQTSPFAIEEGTYRLLEKGFDRFVGRDKLREDILRAIKHDPRIWIINVHGPGGVGKSALVNWAVYELYERREFEAIIHLTAKETVLTPKGIVRYSRSLYSLENLLDHILTVFEEGTECDLETKKTKAIEFLSAWKTLLVLDNMETVGDSRVLEFIQKFPEGVKAKVLLTSRQKTGAWELPFPINELNVSEVKEFLKIRTKEIGVSIPIDDTTSKAIWTASGGLPLAIQWIIGKFRLVGNVQNVLRELGTKDSPVLEFSFGSIWKAISPDAKAVLCVLTIFENPPTIEEIAIATEYAIEKIEKALSELAEATLVTKMTQASDGRGTYVALPITIQFARHQLSGMGDFEVLSRQRFQTYCNQMKLHESEINKFRSRIEKYGLVTDNEKRAAVLCQRGISEHFVGNTDRADMHFKQARDTAPQSSYVLAMYASYELQEGRLGDALNHAREACQRANKRTGSLCYTTLARIHDAELRKEDRVQALERAIEYDPDDLITRHQYGVALSRIGQPSKAIDQFTVIIETEKQRVPSVTFIMALKTRIINNKRLGRLDLVQEDLGHAERIFSEYPHLVSYASDFRQFQPDA